jgi:hypothetical protein
VAGPLVFSATAVGTYIRLGLRAGPKSQFARRTLVIIVGLWTPSAVGIDGTALALAGSLARAWR